MSMIVTPPDAGDAGSVRAAAARLAAGAAGLRDRLTHARSARAAFAEAEGEFAAAFSGTVDTVAAKLDSAASAWDEASEVLTDYANALDAITAEASRARVRVAIAEDAVGPLGFLTASAATPAGSRIAEAQADLIAAEQHLSALFVERAELDRRTESRLSGIGLVSELSLGAGAAAVHVGAAIWADEGKVTAAGLASLGDPALVAAAWAKLSATRRAEILAESPGVLGALGGIPALVRAQANRAGAAAAVKAIDAELAALRARGPGTQSTQPYAAQSAAADHLTRLRELEAQRAYLQRVIDGDVQLYAYDPEAGVIIEMFGDPATAGAILSFMPGTNTTMDSFYSATAQSGITAMTRWEVTHADPRAPIAGFVVKQGDFPQLGGNIFATGPQNNDMAEALGAKYLGFASELRAVAPGVPVVSVEHSFGSAVGGHAETAGAGFEARVMLAGIGMTSDWQRDESTRHFAMQAPNDVNRHLDGFQVLNWGYAHTPSASNGIAELDSGIDGTPLWAKLAAPISPPIAIVADIVSGVEHHNQIISGDPAENRTVLSSVQRILREAAE